MSTFVLGVPICANTMIGVGAVVIEGIAHHEIAVGVLGNPILPRFDELRDVLWTNMLKQIPSS